MRKPAASSTTRTLRCAIYTRKSSEEGLEQDFNSLDAQREACEAYIKSQQHEGWVCLPNAYDDGGRSGATLERPALQALLSDLRAGRIDVIVVYKVDRLTRSLADFAKIVESLDAQGASFVSVTQAFNTTTSMGRLTLNVLLSFAQFEREVTAERIRDKIAASKKKGLWMGGNPPLGYDVQDYKLLVNPEEAKTVRLIFERYVALGNVQALKTDLDARGIVSKARAPLNGQPRGSKPMFRGALYRMLSNRIYRGEIVHNDQVYPGQHDPIIDEPLWNAVQKQLTANRNDNTLQVKAQHASLLTGCLFDDQGRRLTPTHAVKQGRRYRYYITQPLTVRTAESCLGGLRLPAAEVEKLVIQCIRQWLAEPMHVYPVLEAHLDDVHERQRALQSAATLVEAWSTLATVRVHRLTKMMLVKVIVRPEDLEVQLRSEGVVAVLTQADELDEAPTTTSLVTLTLPVRVCQTRGGLRMMVPGASSFDAPNPDVSIVQLLAKAHDFKARVMRAPPEATLKSIAKEAGVTGSYFTRILRLAWLAPDITTALISGNHPPDITAIRLAHRSQLPLDWNAQREMLGLTSA